jgi:hypothetical protein
MTEPLIPFSNYADFRDLPPPKDTNQDLVFSEDTPIDKSAARINEIHNLVDQLPPINRNTLQYLCKFFNRVAKHSNANLITSARIAALMMLSIFRPEKKEALNVSKSGNIGMIFLSMVTYPDEIFREDDFGMP